MEAAVDARRAHCMTNCEITVNKVILATMEKGICTPNQKNTQTVHAGLSGSGHRPPISAAQVPPYSQHFLRDCQKKMMRRTKPWHTTIIYLTLGAQRYALGSPWSSPAINRIPRQRFA
jgi:hypothetical protein